MAVAFRIVKAQRAKDALDGEGARLHGGRWNSPGTAIVYTAQSISLAALELLVHLRAAQLLAASYCTIAAQFDDVLVETLAARAVPADWRRSPAPIALQRIGDRWIAEARSAVLRVPSAIVPSECNYLFNPAHPAFGKIRLARPVAFAFDERLARAPRGPRRRRR